MTPDSRQDVAYRGIARFRLFIALPLLGVALLWASWPALQPMARKWSEDPRYSHGFLVPAFAAFLLWQRRSEFAPIFNESSWWGLPLIALSEAMRLAGARYYVEWVEWMALLPSLAGLCLLVGGWRTLRWAAPPIGFLFFMIPLPYRVELALGSPLQRLGTLASSYALQTLGLPAITEGNTILMSEAKIGVVEACNGLGMLFMFFAYAVATTLITRPKLVDRVLIIVGAIPIAVAANVIRITLTGLLHETAGGHVADAVYHDLAGWLMMPLVLAAFWLEMYLLRHLLVEQATERPLPIEFNPLRNGISPRTRRGIGGSPAGPT